MSKQLRAKFHCNSVTNNGFNEEAKLSAVYANEHNEEDNQFNEASPAGEFSIMIDNPEAHGFFKPGVSYYLDISLVPKDRQSYPEVFEKHFEA